MTDHYLIIDKLRFVEAIQTNGTISSWPAEILDKMFAALISAEGMNVNAFSVANDLTRYSVVRLFDKLDVLEVIYEKPRTYRFKRMRANPVTDYLISQLVELEKLQAFRAGFVFQPGIHNPLIQNTLSHPTEEIPARMIRALTFAVSVAQSLNLYMSEHTDDLADLIKDHIKRDTLPELISELIEYSRLWLLQVDRDS